MIKKINTSINLYNNLRLLFNQSQFRLITETSIGFGDVMIGLGVFGPGNYNNTTNNSNNNQNINKNNQSNSNNYNNQMDNDKLNFVDINNFNIIDDNLSPAPGHGA